MHRGISVTGVSSVTGVTRVTGVTGETDVTRVIRVTDPDYPQNTYAKITITVCKRDAKVSFNSNPSFHFLLPCSPRQFCACTAGHPVQDDSQKSRAKPTNPTASQRAFLINATMVQLLIASCGIHHPPGDLEQHHSNRKEQKVSLRKDTTY